MFDLFRSRDRNVRLILGALLVLVSLSMLTYLIPNYNTGSSSSDMVVADIGKDKLTVLQVQKTLQLVLKQRQLPPEILPHYIPQMIEGMITERALAYEARRLGYEISDADLAMGIRSVVPSLFQDGKFAGKEVYAQYLQQQNTTIEEFEQDMARTMLASRLREIALEGTVVTPAEIEAEYHKRNDKVKLEYVKVSADKFLSQVNPSADDLRRYYDGHKASYMVPEKLNLGILVFDQKKLGESIQVSDAELQKVYDQNKNNFRTPDRVKARHILFSTVGKSKDEEAKIQAKAQDVLKQVRGGADFGELAKKNSEDPGSAAKGGDLDWVTRGQTVPEFEKTAFSLQPKQISDLVKTQYGYHIIQVMEKEQARLKPFDEVKAQLADDYRKQKVNATLQSVIDRAVAMLKKDPMHPENVARDANAQVVRAENVSPNDAMPEIGVNQDFATALAGLRKGEVTQPVQAGSDKIAIASVTDQKPAHPASFEEVQAQVKTELSKEMASRMVNEKANELFKNVANGPDLAKAAKAMGLDVKTSDDFARTGAIEGVGPASYVSDAFGKPAGSLVGPSTLPDGSKLVAKVLAQNSADMGALASQRDTIRDELKSKKARERNQLFEDGIRDRLIQEGKIKIHKEVVDRLVNSQRG